MAKVDKTRSKIRKLEELLKGKKRLLIVMQDNPDPDSIASAVALRRLSNSTANVQCSITHGGSVGRGENRALVRYLGLNLHPIEGIEFEKFDVIAMVDTQPGTGNNSLPQDLVPDIVIDHHPFRRATRKAQLFDVRRAYGATSTILLEYFEEVGLIPDVPLATALLYAIRSDTQDLGREATRADVQAIGSLYQLANKRMLSEIQRGRVQREYFQLLAAALQNARIYNNCIVTGLGEINIPDMVGEVADLLLRDDSAVWTMCYGLFRNKVLISIRTSEVGKRADKVIRYIVARRGTGGGHESLAGGQIPLKKSTKAEISMIEKMVRKKFLHIMGVDDRSGETLIRT